MIALTHGRLRLEVTEHPFRLTVARDGRRLLGDVSVWACAGEVRDQFVTLTEGIIADESREPVERAADVTGTTVDDHGVSVALRLSGGREARLRLELAHEQVLLDLTAADDPLRLAVEWPARADEHFGGLGARHHLRVDHAGREVQLGADRRYTGPDCPPELLEMGGIPQGDYAPLPWLTSSRGYGAWVQCDGNGVRFDLTAEHTTLSARASAGPLRLAILTDPTPTARLRRLLRVTGLPALLPEWAYGFWKSRDVYRHADDVAEDFEGFRRHGIPLDAIVLDSPWETQYNTWIPNPHQWPDFEGMVRTMRADSVRTVVWITPWINLVSDSDTQIPPDVESKRLHAQPASNYAEAEAAGHFVTDDGAAYVARWWMGEGSPIDFTSPAAEAWWRAQACSVLRMGVEGIKADDGEGYFLPESLQFADGRTGAEAAWAYGGLYRASMQAALDEVHPDRGVLFGRCGWTGQQATGVVWAGDQASDFWSLRTLVAATISAASSGYSNWSHDVGGYLGRRLVERAPAELLIRWAQLGAFTPLMQAHARMPQEPWGYGDRVLDLYRAYVLLHERLVPYIRAAARTASQTGLPVIRPLPLLDPSDPRGWSVADAFGFGPALWIAPVLDEGAREREAPLPRGRWIETWSGREVEGGADVVVPAPIERIPVWVRAGSIIISYPGEHVVRGLGDVPEHERPLEATLWGEPPLGRTKVWLADGTDIGWRSGRWSVSTGRAVTFAVR